MTINFEGVKPEDFLPVGKNTVGFARELLDLLSGCMWSGDKALVVVKEWLDGVLCKVDPELDRLREEVELNHRMVAYFFRPSSAQVSYVEDHKDQVLRCGSCPRDDWELFYEMANDEYGREV